MGYICWLVMKRFLFAPFICFFLFIFKSCWLGSDDEENEFIDTKKMDEAWERDKSYSKRPLRYEALAIDSNTCQ